MRLNIPLKQGTFIKLPEVIYAHEERVELSFSSDIYDLKALSVVATNGKRELKKVLRGEAMDITELCTVGELNLTVALMNADTAVKRWRLEPIIIKEADDEMLLIPAVEAMRGELTDLRGELETTKEALKELYTIINDKSI